MIRGRKVPECYALPSQTENLPERPPGSLFGDNPSGWAFGRMGQIYMGRANPFGALVAGLTADECLLLREAVDERRCCGLATLVWTVPGGAQETGGPYMRNPRHPRHFTDEFKRKIVDLHNAGKPRREAMDECGLDKSTVERRVKPINATGSPRAADNRAPEQNRILEPERENRRLRMEVDVLRRAAPAYARK